MGLFSKIVGPSKRTLQATVAAQKAALSTMVRARFDAAQTTDLNRRHWSQADYYSADAALSHEIRRKLRSRARYEIANNSYAAGMASTWANDLVGTGPKIQLDLGPDVDPELVRRVEINNFDWAVNIDLANKLRICKRAKLGDGEIFGIMTTNGRLSRRRDAVTLDFRLIEADQIADPAAAIWANEADGIRFDDDGNPSDYYLLKHHPGTALATATLDGRWVSSDHVLHWFHATRPGQHRGVGEIVPALELFAMLRRYTLAVVTAAETAADFAAILKTTMPADGQGAKQLELLETMPITRGMAIAAPDGWEPVQMKPEQPTSTYDSFVRRLLTEISRAVSMPYIVACMDSSAANYSSMRGDYLVYRKHISTERNDLERVILDPLFERWLDEAALVDGAIPDGLPPRDQWNWRWVWDGFEHIDPMKEAAADVELVSNNMASLADVCAKRGLDWRVVLRQRAIERGVEEEFGIRPEASAPAPQNNQGQEQNQ